MDDHDAQRIAAAMHAARPDWPASSVLTLIRKKLLDRPRRDVFVAFAWVASEPNSATPARVLEQGPWWRAAGVEGATTGRREWPDDAHRCTVCSLPEARCRQLWQDHEFIPASKRADFDVPRIVADLKGRVTTTAPPTDPQPPTTSDPRADVAREALRGAVDA